MDNNRQHPVERILTELINDDWKKFLQSIREENRRSNYRLLSVIGSVKGDPYLQSLKNILGQVGTAYLIRFSNIATGQAFTYPEWVGCGQVQIDQRSTPEGMVMDIYIPVKENKFLWIRKHQ